MSHFEYVSAAHTLLLTFAAARILVGLPDALATRRLYWVHLSWTALAIMYCLTSFWIFWAYREVEWTLPRLIFLLNTPALIYVFSSIVVPADPSVVASWREYFFTVRPSLFGVGFVMVLSAIASNHTFMDISATDSSQLGQYFLLSVFAVGAISASPRLHAILALAPPLTITAILLSSVAQLAWTAP